MTTARQTFANSVASAVAAANNTINAATVLQQETVNSAGNAITALCSGSGNASYVSKVNSAAKTAAATAFAAAQTFQNTVQAAKDTLRMHRRRGHRLGAQRARSSRPCRSVAIDHDPRTIADFSSENRGLPPLKNFLGVARSVRIRGPASEFSVVRHRHLARLGVGL